MNVGGLWASAYMASTLVLTTHYSRRLLPPPFPARVQLAELVFLALLVAWCARGMPGWQHGVRVAGLPLALWLAAVAATSAVAMNPSVAWLEAGALLYLATALVVMIALLDTPERLRAVASLWVALVTLVAMAGLAGEVVALAAGRANPLVYQARDMPFFGSHVFRIRATFAGTSKYLATLLILALPAIFAWRVHGAPWQRRAAIVLLPLFALAELLTFSRQILEFTAVLALLSLAARRRTSGAKVALLLACYLVAALGVQAVSTWHVTEASVTRTVDHSRRLQDRHYYSTAPDLGVRRITLGLEYVHDNYFLAKRAAWSLFLERPLTGWGPNSFGQLLPLAVERGLLPPGFPRKESAHSEIFTTAAEMGLVGVAALVALWTLLLARMGRTRGTGLVGDLARWHAVAVGGVLATGVNLDVMRFRFLWVAVAFGLGAARLAGRAGAPEEAGRVG